jgi:cation transport ATPase
MADAPAVERVTAPVRGMHCAACVGKVERALRGVSGVEQASVNLAIEQASVAFDPARTDYGALQAAVTAAGYELAAPHGGASHEDDAALRADEERATRRKVIAGIALSIPIVLGSRSLRPRMSSSAKRLLPSRHFAHAESRS